VIPTSDLETEFARGSRSTATYGIKSDYSLNWGRHSFKAGIDLNRLRLLESVDFDPRTEETELEAFAFAGGKKGGQASLYIQDHLKLTSALTADVGLRWDHFDLLRTDVQVSPRFGVAYSIAKTRTVVHAAYNRFFTPPPIEYALLSSHLGEALDSEAAPGVLKPYVQDYYEAGVTQGLSRQFIIELTGYHHRGRNSFENSELGASRIFAPTNFAHARAWGAEVALNMNQLQRVGLSARVQYAIARVNFFGPVSGGFADEEVPVGEMITPAFDQRHTATASLMYRNRWRDAWAGWNLHYGSGTPAEMDEMSVRLTQHLTADLAAGMNLMKRERTQLTAEINIENISNSIYEIAKESEVTPVQFAPRRVFAGRMVFHF
jgi:outer membrane receptor protein involved in Fe transport